MHCITSGSLPGGDVPAIYAGSRVRVTLSTRPSRLGAARPPRDRFFYKRDAHLRLALLMFVGGAHERVATFRAYHLRDSDFVGYWMGLAQPGRKT
jgi:hypothetical protein